MSNAVLDKEFERLDETQRNTAILFMRFLLSQKESATQANVQSKGNPHRNDSFWNSFMSARTDVSGYIDHEWSMDEIDEEIANARKERMERCSAGARA